MPFLMFEYSLPSSSWLWPWLPPASCYTRSWRSSAAQRGAGKRRKENPPLIGNGEQRGKQAHRKSVNRLYTVRLIRTLLATRDILRAQQDTTGGHPAHHASCQSVWHTHPPYRGSSRLNRRGQGTAEVLEPNTTTPHTESEIKNSTPSNLWKDKIDNR